MRWAVVAQALNLSSQEAEAGGSQWSGGQPGLQSKFQDSQGYTKRAYNGVGGGQMLGDNSVDKAIALQAHGPALESPEPR